MKPGYGYVHKDQIDWFKDKYTEVKESLLPYHPDGTADLPHNPGRGVTRCGMLPMLMGARHSPARPR